MIFSKELSSKIALILCIIATFSPLGSFFGVVVFWGVIPLISIVMSLYGSGFKININWIFPISVVFIIISINYIVTIQYMKFFERVNINFLLSVFGLFFVSIVFYSRGFLFSYLPKAIDLGLCFILFFFFVQFISFYVFGYVIDYSYLTGGIGSRNLYGSIFRSSGLFNEPAEYASGVIVLLVIRYLINPLYNKINYVALASVLLSFSFAGIFQALFVFFVTRLDCSRKKVIPMIIGTMIFLFCSLLFKDYFLDRYALFISGTDGSNNTKIDVVNFFINNLDYLLFGAGLVGYSTEHMPLFMQGLYDLTFFGANITIFGLILGMVLNFISIAFIFLKFRISDALLILISLLKVNVMVYSSYWFLFFSVIFIAVRRKRKVSFIKNV